MGMFCVPILGNWELPQKWACFVSQILGNWELPQKWACFGVCVCVSVPDPRQLGVASEMKLVSK